MLLLAQFTFVEIILAQFINEKQVQSKIGKRDFIFFINGTRKNNTESIKLNDFLQWLYLSQN